MRLRTSLLLIPLALAATACRKEAPPVEAKVEARPVESEPPPQEEPAATSPSESGGLDRIATAAQDGDRAKLRENWSTEELVDELQRRGLLEKLDAVARARVMAAVDEHFDLLSSYLIQRIGESRKVVMTTIVPETKIHLVYERTRQDDGSRDTIIRYWLRERDGRMQLIDCEDLTLGYRASVLVLGLVAPADSPWQPPLLALLEKLKQAGGENPFDVAVTVAAEVDALLATAPPADLRAFALKLKGERLIMEDKPEAALKVIAEFAAIQPKSPWADFLLGLALTNLQRDFEAITAFNRYAKIAGWDATTHSYVAWCHYTAGDESSALKHAMAGLALNRNATDCLLTAVLSTKPADMAGLAEHFKATFDHETTYEYVIDQAIGMEEEAIARAVFDLLRQQLPESKLVATYEKKLEQAGK